MCFLPPLIKGSILDSNGCIAGLYLLGEGLYDSWSAIMSNSDFGRDIAIVVSILVDLGVCTSIGPGISKSTLDNIP